MRLTRKRPDTDGTVQGVPVDEALADLRLGWISRSLDDREIARQILSELGP